jgi:hypothetical protein
MNGEAAGGCVEDKRERGETGSRFIFVVRFARGRLWTNVPPSVYAITALLLCEALAPGGNTNHIEQSNGPRGARSVAIR